MKHLVVSAVNLVEGGTLEILRQCLQEAVHLDGWSVSAVVHDAKTVSVAGVNYIERPEIKRSWLKRIWFEYRECQHLAEELQPDYWLSLHDLTPSLGRLTGKIPQAVYCHNAMCFYRMPWREMWLDPTLILFSVLYPLFYRINLQRNSAVVVQQEWIRRAFRERFGCANVVVAHPLPPGANRRAKVRAGRRFFYPSFPRVFKNFETVLAAWELLCADPAWDGELTLTISEASNRYGAELTKRYGHLRNVRFLGRISPSEVQSLYENSDCLVFPSKLETWGLPISEAKQLGLSILASDLPYAHEAVGDYDGAAFFPPEDPGALADLMRSFRQAKLQLDTPRVNVVPAPFADHWSGLLQMLLSTQRTT